MNTFRTRPNWVDEEPLIQSILHSFIDQVEKNVKPSIRINSKNSPELYDYIDDDPEYLWDLLKSLDNEYHVCTLKKHRGRIPRDNNENAQLFFNTDKEGQIREWLNRPAFDPYTLTWNERFNKIYHLFEDGGQALETPLRVEGRGASEVLHGFAQLAEQIQRPQTLRNLSAKCFWGDSKFLDDKLDLLNKLFPNASQNIQTRPILLSAYVPDSFDKLVFIENLDTFLMMARLADSDVKFSHIAFIYSSGFKGSNRDIRKRGKVEFSRTSSSGEAGLKRLKAWWSNELPQQISPFFWGDLDYAAMSILANLKKSFPSMKCWQQGYDCMLHFYNNGLGHSQFGATQIKQRDPGFSGCEYCDERILPLLRENKRFLDQEVVAAHDLLFQNDLFSASCFE